MNVSTLSAHQLSQALKNRSLRCDTLIQTIFRRIKALDPKVKAFLHLNEADAMEKAKQLDEELDKGVSLPALAGLPIVVKDNICIQGQKTTCASKILENYVSPYDATVIEKIKSQRLIIIGKTNLDEFAMGSSTENSAFFSTHNPWDLDRVPGGSSGGSAAAVASNFSWLALGSDTGGSVRQPAAMCGIVGIKPTYGRVSRYGLIAYSSSFDQIGAFSKTVPDCALLLNAICGYDAKDSTSSSQPIPDFTQALNQDIKGIKIGVPEDLINESIHPEITQAVISALDLLQKNGAHWEPVQLQSVQYTLPTYYILATAEASSNLERFDGVRYGYRSDNSPDLAHLYRHSRGQGFGPEVKRRIILGTFSLSSGYYDAYYLKAQKTRNFIRNELDQVFQKYDIIMMPTTPSPAFKIGEIRDPLTMYKEDICTIPANIAGLPGLSIPCGFTPNNLPIGLQLIGKAFDEFTLIRVADHYQHLTHHHQQLSPIAKMEVN